MKPHSHLLVAAVLSVGLTGCGKSPVPEQSDGPSQGSSVILGRDFTLRPGESIRLAPRSLLVFVAVPEDSRCPPEVQCIWEGNAQLAMKLDDTRFAINSTVEPREAMVRGYRFQLVALTQRPLGDTVTAHYSATLKVTR